MIEKKLNLSNIIINIWLMILTIIITIITILLTIVYKNGNKVHLCTRIWAKMILMSAKIKTSVSGLRKIKPNKAYIYMPNHQSNIDIPILLHNIPYKFKWLAKAELFDIPVWGTAMKKCGHISIDRNDKKSAFGSINYATKVLKNGTSVLIFPEGTRSKNENMSPLKKGGFILSIKSGVPIVPITINGSYKTMPKGSLKIRSSKIKMIIHNPIKTKEFTLYNKEKLISKVEQILRNNLYQ